MFYVVIDVAKDKHDCIIVNSDGDVLYIIFTIQNIVDGFEDLLLKNKVAEKPRKVIVALKPQDPTAAIFSDSFKKGLPYQCHQSIIHQSM